MMVWEVLSSPNRYTKARLIIPLMKQIFPVLCKRNILRVLTTHRTEHSHLHSEYRNEGNDRRIEAKESGKNKTALVRFTLQQRGAQ
jgi:hypothetical protein